jgi:hypothetical protein
MPCMTCVCVCICVCEFALTHTYYVCNSHAYVYVFMLHTHAQMHKHIPCSCIHADVDHSFGAHVVKETVRNGDRNICRLCGIVRVQLDIHMYTWMTLLESLCELGRVLIASCKCACARACVRLFV